MVVAEEVEAIVVAEEVEAMVAETEEATRPRGSPCSTQHNTLQSRWVRSKDHHDRLSRISRL